MLLNRSRATLRQCFCAKNVRQSLTFNFRIGQFVDADAYGVKTLGLGGLHFSPKKWYIQKDKIL